VRDTEPRKQAAVHLPRFGELWPLISREWRVSRISLDDHYLGHSRGVTGFLLSRFHRFTVAVVRERMNATSAAS
jgi:hypothetical protein